MERIYMEKFTTQYVFGWVGGHLGIMGGKLFPWEDLHVI